MCRAARAAAAHSEESKDRLASVIHLAHALLTLMFESGAKIEKEPLVCFKAAPAVNTTSATAEDIATSQCLLVIFVITIVVVSPLYFSAALIVELSRSCSHFLKVHRSREKDKKEDA